MHSISGIEGFDFNHPEAAQRWLDLTKIERDRQTLAIKKKNNGGEKLFEMQLN